MHESDADKVLSSLSDGIEALAKSLVSRPLGARGDVTVGVGDKALVCVADREVATGSITHLGESTRKIKLDASFLNPGGVRAAAECAAILRASRMNGDEMKLQLMRAEPA
jgi:hypothetical protein